MSSWIAITTLSFFLSVTFTFAQTSTTTECLDEPFSNAQERKKVERENNECYLLRIEYEESVQDSMSLQDIGSSIQGIQMGLQFLQQLQSLGGQNSNNGPTNNNETFGTSPQNQTIDSFLQSNNEPANTGYTNGQSPSTYFQGSDFVTPTTTIVSFGQAGVTRTYRVTDNIYTDVDTEETFTWAEVQVREGLVINTPSDSETQPTTLNFPAENYQPANPTNDRMQIVRDNLPHSSTEVFAALLTRPDPATNRSHPLSPNLFASFSNQLTGAARLFDPNADTSDTQFSIFAGGMFSPLQNLIVGISNGITSLFSRL